MGASHGLPEDSGSEHIPIDPQTFLTYMEEIEKANGQPVNGAVHLMLMVSVAQAIAVVEMDEGAEGVLAHFLCRVEGWLEHAIEQVPSMPEQDRIRLEYRSLRKSAEEWIRHFRARDADSTDTEPQR